MAGEDKARILIIEDEDALRESLKINLKKQGFKVLTAADGETGLEKALNKSPDLVLLDVMLPGMDGFSLVNALRKHSDVPVLILSARTSELDRIVGLESGADDYLIKPFSVGELIARVRALLRRTQRVTVRDRLEAGPLQLDLVSRQATLRGKPLSLSPREFSLLAELIRHQGAVLSRDLLLSRVWGMDYMGDPRTVDVHVRWLREKIEDNPSQPRFIRTVRGVGYRFVPGEEAEDADEEV
ncbi:MAG: DNA-binding response regulator [Caldilineae bacterium]|nr:MAG: DNA-binding response regulator [Caldilineae bacterium]